MTQERLMKKEAVIEELVKDFLRNRNDFNTVQRIWIALWEIRFTIFYSKRTRGYLNFSPSPIHASGEEFLTDVFNESFPKILKSYRPRDAAGEDEGSKFIPYFIMKYGNYVWNAVREIKVQNHKLELVVHKVDVTAYLKKAERTEDGKKTVTWVPCDQSLVPEKHYTVLREDYEGSQRWLMVELQAHGRQVYVKEEDVEYIENNTQGSLEPYEENIPEKPAEPIVPDEPGGKVEANGMFELYALTLLSLAQKLYGRAGKAKCVLSSGRLTKFDSFKLFYTEKLMEDVKKCFEFADMKISRERDVLAEAEFSFIDYLLSREDCRTLYDIAVTAMKKYSDFSFMRDEPLTQTIDQELSFPVAQMLYVAYLQNIKHAVRSADSLKSSLSSHRTEFDEQYTLLCENEFKRRLAEEDYRF